MTWIAHCTVMRTDNASVYLEGAAASQVRPWASRGDDREVPSVTSNTEGTILRVALELEFDVAAALSVGDVITVQGSFDRQPSPASVEFRGC